MVSFINFGAHSASFHSFIFARGAWSIEAGPPRGDAEEKIRRASRRHRAIITYVLIASENKGICARAPIHRADQRTPDIPTHFDTQKKSNKRFSERLWRTRTWLYGANTNSQKVVHEGQHRNKTINRDEETGDRKPQTFCAFAGCFSGRNWM